MRDGGRITLIGSNTAIPALTGLVRGAAIDLAPRAITVNIQPGRTATDMSATHADVVKSLIPLRRMGRACTTVSATKEPSF